MKHDPGKSWSGEARPICDVERKPQVAALCCRERDGATEVLLVTSRDTGRWIVPKGWPMAGLADHEAALQEAWEEAGVRTAKISSTPIGHYDYDKGVSGAADVPVTVSVYLAQVSTLKDEFPESHERTRRWVRPKKAAKMVAEPELRDILRAL